MFQFFWVRVVEIRMSGDYGRSTSVSDERKREFPLGKFYAALHKVQAP